MINDPLLYFIVFIVGLCLGSFLNVLVYRLPNEMNVANPPSACPSCKNQLKWFHNIPVFSWLFLKGRCGFCNEKISALYPSLELLIGFLGLGLYYLGLNYLDQNYLQFSAVFLMFYLYIAMSIIDYKTHLVHDVLNYPAMILAFFVSNDFTNSLIIGFGTGLSIFAFTWVYGKIRGFQVMGEGDVPILIGMAAILGLEGFIPAILISSLLGIIVYLFQKEKELAFIPLLVGGTFIMYLVKATIGLDFIYKGF